MNNARRKEIRALETRIEALGVSASALAAELDEVKGAYEDIKNAEQEAFDNLPESLQAGERGDAMTAAVEALEELDGLLDEHKDALESFTGAITEIVSKSDEAKGSE